LNYVQLQVHCVAPDSLAFPVQQQQVTAPQYAQQVVYLQQSILVNKKHSFWHKPKLEKQEVDLNKNLGHGGYSEVFQGINLESHPSGRQENSRIPLDKINSQEEAILCTGKLKYKTNYIKTN
jgi:hypothetical protein